MRRSLVICAMLCVSSLCHAQGLNAAQQYEFIGEFRPSDYLEMAKNVKDPSQISDIRRTILERQDLSKDEKVNLITEVGEIQIDKIETEGRTERNWIYAEAAISASIRAVNLFFNKNPTAASAVDAFAQQILEGNVRDAVVKGAETGDWSGLLKVGAGMGIDMALGKAITSGLEKIPAVKNAVAKVGEKVVEKVGVTGTRFGNPLDFKSLNVLRDKWNVSAVENAELKNEVEVVLKPRLTQLEGEMKAISAKISKVGTQDEKAILEKSLVTLKNDFQDVSNQIARKNSEIVASEALINQYVRETEEISKRLLHMDFSGSLDDSMKALIENYGGELIKNGVSSIPDFVARFSEVADSSIQGEIQKKYDQAVNAVDKAVKYAYAEAETKYRQTMSKIEYGDDNHVVLTGAISKDVYIGASTDSNSSSASSTESSGVEKVDTDSLYESLDQLRPAETKSNQELANEKFGEIVESITGDKNLAQKIKDLVTSKIDEAIKKGEEWIENGGIRNEIKKQVEKAIDGKVSEEDKQRILNLTDKLCNVKDDGGKSFVEALGTDGKDLAASLAVNEIKKQISSALPKDVADNVNAMVDAIASTGNLTDPAVKQKLLETVQAAVKEYLPYENSANAINDLLQQIADGKGIDVMDAAKDLGKAIGIDALKEAISKNLDPEAAAKVNALIDGYTKNGVEGLTDAALAEINAAIDKYAPGADSAAALKDVLQSMKDGTITADKIKDAVKAVGVDGAKALIDKSNLSDEAKKAAKEAIDAVAKDGWSGLTDTAKKYIEQYVTDKLGEEAGQAIGNIFDAITTPGVDVWDAIDKNGPIIGEAIFNKVCEKFETWAQKQLDKLIGKNPFLKELFGRLGIDGKSIVAGIKNIWGVLKDKGFSELFDALSQQALAWFKSAVAKLIDWGVEKLCELANQVLGKVLDWLSDLLGKVADKTDLTLLKNALKKLQGQLDAAKTNGTIKIKVGGVGQKVVDWFEGKMKKSSGTEKAKGTFK